jgi:DNA-binding NarL/FixJ family response regulator
MNSKKGIGTTCVVKLPFKISRETEIRRPAEKENISVAGLRALVVEDNELNMDIMMPRLNGLDATRKIRSLKRSDAQKIPVISSANAFADDIINSRISGMNLHLSKPLDEEKIVSAIKECIVSRKIEIPSV